MNTLIVLHGANGKLLRPGTVQTLMDTLSFADLGSARYQTRSYVHTYHHAHRHRALRLVTPAEKHSGEDRAILRLRKVLYENAQKPRPDRWFRKTTRN